MKIIFIVLILQVIGCSSLKKKVPDNEYRNKTLTLKSVKNIFAKYNVTPNTKRNLLVTTLNSKKCNPQVIEFLLQESVEVEPSFIGDTVEKYCLKTLSLFFDHIKNHHLKSFINKFRVKNDYSNEYRNTLVALARHIKQKHEDKAIDQSVRDIYNSKIPEYEKSYAFHKWTKTPEGRKKIKLKRICDTWASINYINAGIKKEKHLGSMSGYVNAYNLRLLNEQLYTHQLHLSKLEKTYDKKPNYAIECKK